MNYDDAMQHSTHRTLWLVVFVASLMIRGAYSNADDSADGIAYFETKVRPILSAHCYECHSVRDGKKEGGLRLDSRDGWTVGGKKGPAIVPGNIDASLLIRAVRYADADLQMPPDEPLPKDAIEALEQWVRIGAPDPRLESPPNSNLLDDPSDPIKGREHWAFRPLRQATWPTQPDATANDSPTAESSDWARSAIDEFVANKRRENKLQPSADADQRTFARRLYVQLTGLPPRPEQIDRFVADESVDSRERLVDQLLASPQYGERWGRHWLDLARFADSNGLDENFLFREAWRYRNWVIQAVNNDVPFDRFISEQIAGDLLPFESIAQRDRQRIAAGFLLVGPKVLLGVNENKQKMDIADEQLETIGRAILGQTVGCARCHDHKFDPIPTKDYYALAGILTSTEVMERRYMLGEQRLMERLEGLGEGGEVVDDAYEAFWRQRPSLQERQKRVKLALELLEKGDQEGLVAHAAKFSDSVADGATNADEPNEQRIEKQKALLAELNKQLGSPPKIPPRAMVPHDRGTPANEVVRLAGQFDRRGEEVPRGFLRVIGDSQATMPMNQSGRIELSHWLSDWEGGAGRLTARVLANRIWQHLIGRGIVRTTDNFGRTGEAPTNLELLDFLAVDLIHSNWSAKRIVRNVALSRTFAMSSQHNDSNHAVDPENKFLWRANRRRMEPEVLRDAMLQGADELDLKPIDSTVSYLGDQATAVGDNKVRRRTDFPNRSVYLPVIRNDLPELFDAFDFADPHATTGTRSQTMVATQGLFVLNSDSVIQLADATSKRLLASAGEQTDENAELVNRMFRQLIGREPTDEDRSDVLRFVETMKSRLTSQNVPEARVRAWSMACQALYASSRFQIVE